jgi:hypothetical protein
MLSPALRVIIHQEHQEEAAMAVLACTGAFAYSEPNGVQRVLRPGDLVDEKDPCVKGREVYFEPVEANVHRATERAAGREVNDGVIEGPEKGKAAKVDKAVDERTDSEREADANAELGRLQVEAEAAGVKVDKRWGVDRLRDEIAKAEAG